MIGALMSRLGPRQRDPIGAVPLNPAKVRSACLLAHFVDALRKRPEPIVVELGPATEGNVAFLGEHVACRIFVEDLLDKLPLGEAAHSVVPPPLQHANESVDGILCWDIFDYLSPSAGQDLADDLARILRPGGALLLYHRTESMSDPAPGQVRDRRRGKPPLASLQRRRAAPVARAPEPRGREAVSFSEHRRRHPVEEPDARGDVPEVVRGGQSRLT